MTGEGTAELRWSPDAGRGSALVMGATFTIAPWVPGPQFRSNFLKPSGKPRTTELRTWHLCESLAASSSAPHIR